MMALAARPDSAQRLAHSVGGTLHGTPGSTPVRALCDDSRRVVPGAAFFARAGAGGHGAHFAQAALLAGAAVVVSEEPLAGVLSWIQVKDVEQALVQAADDWFDTPQRALGLCGVTGTKGKTTTTQLLGAALRSAGHITATLGTVEHDLGDGRALPSSNTTPGVLELRELLARARAVGATHGVLEVSSHGLAQGRTRGLDFEVGVFTNLGRDHLDYHVSAEAYFRAKARLFEGLSPSATAVLNREDPRFEALCGRTAARVLSYGWRASADLYPQDLELGPSGTSFTLHGAQPAPIPIQTALVGRHNVLNLLAAIGAAMRLGVDAQVAARGAAALPGVRGRLQRVAAPAGPQVYVDYAHTAEALREVLAFLREVCPGPVTCVVGCGGDRDRGKRPEMARAAVELAQRAVFTSDNPRSEDPQAILDDMLAGLSQAQRASVLVLPDRREAILRAVSEAPESGCVLIAGKGHEAYQQVGERRFPFDDVREATEALARRAAGSCDEGPAWGTPRRS